MTESEVALFEKLVHIGPPGDAPVLFDTACVLGGSVAGLLAARVLSDRAHRVFVLDPDDLASAADPGARPGVPQNQQVHTLLPAGRQWVERWLPGITAEAQDRGAPFVPDTGSLSVDGVPQVPGGECHHFLAVGRPLLEALIRHRVMSLPNVSFLRSRATGLEYRDDAVRAVRHVTSAPGTARGTAGATIHATTDGQQDDGENGDGDEVLDADFVVDATGRSSRLSHWVGQGGYDRPRLERLAAPINYATALFDRPVRFADLETPSALALFTPEYPSGGVSVAAAQPIEGERWIVLLMGYGDSRPGRTVDAFRETCARLPAIFATATAGAVIGDVMTYRQADSRRRHFTGLRRFPGGLVGVGDAVASFNPVYGQGMSSAALHASCLAAYLGGDPAPGTAAREFFRLQQVVVDAAWAVSAGGDAARLDALNGTEVPDDVRRQRRAMERITAATLLDGDVTRAFNDVSYMLRHPATLADPALLARAVAAAEASDRNIRGDRTG